MGLLGDLVDTIFTNDTGKYGESLTALKLDFLNLSGKKGITLKNIYLPKDDGGTSEIDLVYITQKGIFVIESKNYSGWIFGDENSQYWTQSLPNKQKNRFYNPIRQNRTHIKWLKEYLGGDVFCYSLIVFSERCELKRVRTKSADLCVINRDELTGELRYLWKKLDDTLNEVQIQEISQKLALLTNPDEAVKQAHINSINARYHNPAAKPKPEVPEPQKQDKPESAPKTEPVQETAAEAENMPESAESESCPRCGAPLVLRTAKKGENAGNQFYGCSAFPKCRYIRQMEANHYNSFSTEE